MTMLDQAQGVGSRHVDPAPGGRLRARARRLVESDASFVMPAVVFMAALVVFPTIYAAWISLTHWNLATGAPRTFAGLHNYGDLLSESRFWGALARTLVFCAASTLLTLIVGMALALLLNRRLPGKTVFRTLLIVPMVVTPVVVGLAWRFMYNPDLGMVNWFLGLFGVEPIAFLGQTGTSLPAVIFTDVWEYTPFAFLILLAGLESLPKEPFEAAELDGSSAVRTFWHITLPMMKGPLAVALLFRLMFSFNVFDTLYVMTGGGPGRSSETLSMYSYRLGFTQWEVGKAAAAALISLVLITVLARVIVRYARLQTES
jgi:multiple sugar transport system permease protein